MLHARLVPISSLLLLVLPLLTTAQETPRPDSPVQWLADAERAFARASVEKGVRASFLEFFAPDGISFRPHPVNTREALAKQPAPAAKPPVTLNWAPITGDVSAAGDLGYTTGPYLLTDDREPTKVLSQGFYFSVWKKQPHGTWRVLLDYGIQTPPLEANALSRPFVPARATTARVVQGANVDTERAAVLQRDREFLSAVGKDGLLKAYSNFTSWTQETRLHRWEKLPVVGAAAIRDFLSAEPTFTEWNPITGDVARSADLGYTYGSWQRVAEGTAEKGYYVRVWKRSARGWVVVAESMDTLPPDAP